MTDREEFEDGEIVDRYLTTIAKPATAYRTTLLAQLAGAPAPRRFHLPWLRWQWTTGASIAIAAVLALALLVLPVGPHHDAPLNPRTLLARALDATTHIPPYRATAEMSFIEPEDGAPAAATRDLGANHLIMHSAVRDGTHWRVDVRVLRPALLANEEVAIANGASAIWYQSITNRAVRYVLSPSQPGSGILSMVQAGQGVPLGQTLGQYVHELDNPKRGRHARLLGQKTLLGRTVDVIQVWPADSIPTPSCARPPNHPAPCPVHSQVQFKGYGYVRLWIDRQYGLVLRYQDFGIPAQLLGTRRDFLYRVTAIRFGVGPTATELSYRPPVQPAAASVGSTGPQSTSTSWPGVGPGIPWMGPPGSFSPGPPPGPKGARYALVESGGGFDPTFGTESVNGTFRLRRPGAGPMGPNSGPFLYVDQQRRVAGLPKVLRAGTRQRAGRCTVFTGRYRDGLRWLALARGDFSLLAVANALDQRALVAWAGAQVCP